MDTNSHSQPFLPKRNDPIPKSLPQLYATQSEPSDEEQVLKELGKIVAAGRRRAILIIGVAIAVTAAAGFFLSKRPAMYEGKFQLLVEPVTTSQSRLLSLLSQTEGDRRALINGKDHTLDYETQIRVLLSPQLMYPILKGIQEKYPRMTYEALLGNLLIERPFKEDVGTRILEVTYKDKDPEKVEFILNVVSKAYLKYSLQDRQTNLKKGINFIEEQIPTAQVGVNTLQDKLQKLRQQYNLIDPKIQGELFSRQAYDIESQKRENQAKLAELRSLYVNRQRLLSEQNPSSILVESPFAYSQLLKDIQQLDSKIAMKSAQFRDDSELMQALSSQKQSLNLVATQEAQKMQEKVAVEIHSIEERNRAILQAQNNLNQQVRQFQIASRQYADLQQQLEVANESLKQLLATREGLRIDAAQQELPWELIAPPELPRGKDGKPLKAPISKKLLFLVAIFGLAMGISAAVLAEIMNNVFHAPEDIEDETKLPLLAVIPFDRKLKKQPKPPRELISAIHGMNLTQRFGQTLLLRNGRKIHDQDNSPVVESFRSLYTNIRLLSPETLLHSLVISAATPGEGKTTVAMSLAQTAATIGQRVLLVDADLRRPKIHTKLGLPNGQGLSDILTQDIGLNDAIQRSPFEDKLFVLTAGTLPKDPIKLLSSEKMRYLMEQFQSFFDLVIYDTPPLVGLADGNFLAAHTDGTVLVVGLEKTDRFMVMKALDGLAIGGASVLGVVANGIKGYKSKAYTVYYRR